MPNSWIVTNEPYMFLDVSISTTQTTGIILSSPQLNGANHTFGSLSGGVLRIKSGAFYEDIYYATATIGADNRVTLATGVIRNVDPALTTTIVTAGAGRAWAKGSVVEMTVDARLLNLSVKTDSVQTVSGAKTFTAPVVVSGNGNYIAAPSMTTGNAPATADARAWYDSTQNLWQFGQGGTIAVLGAASLADATTSVKGKSQLAAAADTIAGTAGAVVIPASLAVATSAGAGDSGKVPILNTSGALATSLGGTGNTSSSPNLLIATGTGAGANAYQALAAGSAGQFLGSNGAGNLPTMQAVPIYSKVVYCSGVSSTALTNPTTNTAFDTHTFSIPNNDIFNGISYEVEGTILLTPNTSSTESLSIMLGSTIIVNPSITVGISSNIGYFRGSIFGTAVVGASVAVKGGMAWGITGVAQAFLGASANVATNGALTLQLGFIFGTSNASNSVTITSCKFTKVSSTAF